MKYLQLEGGKVVGIFTAPQPSYPDLVEVEDDDSRTLPPLPDQGAVRDELMSLAALRIAPLQDAADLDDATSGELARLKAWKQYRVALNRTDVSISPVAWPKEPE